MPNKPKDFKWKHFQASIILWAVRWYSRFAISYRDLVIMAKERGLSITHTTLMRWVHEYAPKLAKKVKPHLKSSNDSYRVDETYIKIKGNWQYLYRAVDSTGNTLDWMLSRYRNESAAKRFFKKIISNPHCKVPRVINVDKAKAFPPAFAACQAEELIPKNTKLRRQKYLNNIQEQDHRFIKRRVRQSQWFQSFNTARKTIDGYEAMHMIRKGQVKNVNKGNVIAEIQFINNLFAVAA
jgi:transposase-like protein